MASSEHEQQHVRVQRPDYANRHRQLEGRTRWFHLGRTSDDRLLERIFNKALDHKLISEGVSGDGNTPEAYSDAIFSTGGPS